MSDRLPKLDSDSHNTNSPSVFLHTAKSTTKEMLKAKLSSDLFGRESDPHPQRGTPSTPQSNHYLSSSYAQPQSKITPANNNSNLIDNFKSASTLISQHRGSLSTSSANPHVFIQQQQQSRTNHSRNGSDITMQQRQVVQQQKDPPPQVRRDSSASAQIQHTPQQQPPAAAAVKTSQVNRTGNRLSIVNSLSVQKKLSISHKSFTSDSKQLPPQLPQSSSSVSPSTRGGSQQVQRISSAKHLPLDESAVKPPLNIVHPSNTLGKYGTRSRAGALPGKPIKINQDSSIVQVNFQNNSSTHFFGVCDGHGVNGHHVSQLVKKHLGDNVNFYLNQLGKSIHSSNDNNDLFSKKQLDQVTQQSLASGFLRTTKVLIESGIDLTFSGSTCVVVYVTPTRYWCANIGDSRAIIARSPYKHATSFSTEPLSIDHKPDSEGECQRIIASGGRVSSYLDPYGNPIGPARVWLRHENIPGLAMARSFGDQIAGQVGVIAEPEVLTFEATQYDRFIVIASDGVWEFLSNEEVVQLIAPFYAKNDPDGACEKIVQVSTAAWKREDDVIDDITVIVLFLNSSQL